ncbi:uncharacterized protein LOC132643947 [Lycium barbarum]|uniref:uncharacterized protein LOC132643947 n=1 Tax=Lycium barbarum TaxID=112863 RepID=UPI00293E8C5C|nr:uncharacterized protein LOC132643947 [Lycium barbarum]
MLQVVRKLKMLKRNLKKLYQQNFSNIVKEALEDKISMLNSQEKLQHDLLDVTLQQEEKRQLKLKYRKSAELDEVFLVQRSKAIWIKLRDDNTIFFLHNHTEENHTVSVSFRMSKAKCYRQLLGENGGPRRKAYSEFFNQGPKLSVEHPCSLLRNFFENEIRDAIFSININKCPGSDSYGSGFFKEAWSVVGQDICMAVWEFMNTGEMLKEFNATLISLIPKVRILLSAVLPFLVNDTQAAFVKGRHHNRKTSSRCLMKIDLRKAYDMVKWEFVQEMLEGFYLMCKEVQLTHLIFGDDLMIFYKGTKASVQRIMEALQHISVVTWLTAKSDKFSIYMAGVDDEIRIKLLEIIGFSIGTFPMNFWGAIFHITPKCVEGCGQEM